MHWEMRHRSAGGWAMRLSAAFPVLPGFHGKRFQAYPRRYMILRRDNKKEGRNQFLIHPSGQSGFRISPFWGFLIRQFLKKE